MGTHKGTHVYVLISKLVISMNCLKPPVLDISTTITTKTQFEVFCGNFCGTSLPTSQPYQ